MNKEVIEKIDLLVEMSGTTNKYETLNEELNVVDNEIELEKNKINDMKKKLSSDFSYTRSNERIVDENTKMGLENRRVITNKDLEELKELIEETSNEEESKYASLTELENELKQSRHFIESIELKMKTNASNKDSYSFYENLLEKNIHSIKEKEQEKKKKENEYNELVSKMESLGNERDYLENRLKDLDSKIAMITESLINPKSYIDQKSRQKDERLLDKYKEELDRLETRRIAIITDPAYIGHEAQELYIEEDKTSALEKIKELVTIVKAKAYMDKPVSEISSLIEKATTKRDEFASQIENKSYDVGDNSIITLRVQYLKEQKKKKEKEIEELRSKINKIDSEEVNNLVRYVEDTRNYKEELARDIEDYKNVLNKESDNKSPKKQASLKAALLKKQEEYSLVQELLNNFENDLEKTVIKSKTLEESGIENLKEDIESLDEQITQIERKEALNSHTKDILRMEKDRDTLKTLDEEVESLKHREKYTSSASEILDQIEVSLETKETPNSLPIEEEKEEDIANEYTIPNEYLPPIEDIETIKIDDEEVKEEPQPIEEPKEQEENNRFKVIDMELLEPEEPVPEEQQPIIEPIITPPKEEVESPLIEEKEMDLNVKEYDPFASNNNSDIIEPITLNAPEKENNIENDILMQDEFQDTGYISFNDLLEGDN